MEEFVSASDCRIPWPHHGWDSVTFAFPSSFAHLLHHNHPPSPREIARVKKFRDSVQRNLLQQNEQQIQRLQDQLDRLRNLQISLKKQVFACNVILAPFRRLPADILHEIISHCPASHLSNTYAHPKSHLPSVLAQTSRAWRQAVHSTSRLWQNLHFAFEDWGTGADYIMTRFDMFARLSRSRPLSVRIDKRVFTGETYDWSQVSFLQWLLSVWRNRERMTRVSVSGIDPATVVQQWQIDVGGLPYHPTPFVKSVLFLEEDRVYGDGLECKTVTKLLDILPRLQHLWLGCRVSELGKLNQLSSISLQSWSKLKTLYMGTSFSALDWRALLETCPNLEAAFVHIHHDPAQYGATPPSTLVHHYLKTLFIRFTIYSHSIVAPFCCLNLLSLHSLEIAFIHCTFSLPLPRYLRVNGRLTFPSLKSLRIHNTGEIQGAIDRIFPLFSVLGHAITTFHISPSFRHVHDLLSFLCGWSVHSKEVRPFPYLHSLTVEFYPEPTHWNDKLPTQLAPLFTDVLECLRLPDARVLERYSFLIGYSPIPWDLNSMIISLITPARQNKTKTARKINRFFTDLQKRYQKERIGIHVRIEEAPENNFEAYERRFMDLFEV